MLRAQHETGLVFFPAFDWAISPTHAEREERRRYTQDQVIEEGLFDIQGIHEFKPDQVNLMDVQRVHFCVPDPWKVMTESHFISAGGAKTIGKAVLEKKIERGFALVRPPGHHAMRIVHGARGFCNVNIEAIMIEHLRQAYGIDRVAIAGFLAQSLAKTQEHLSYMDSDGPVSMRLDQGTDGMVLTFVLGAALLTTFLFGLIPALRAAAFAV